MHLITCNLCKTQCVGQTPNHYELEQFVTSMIFDMRLIPTPVANHFNLPGHSLEGNFEIIPIEQPLIVGSKTEADQLRLEREAFWIRTLQTKKPFGINVESGKPVERAKIIFLIIYNSRNVDIGKIMKEEYLNLQTVMKKSIMARQVIAYRKNPSLKGILVSTRLPTNLVTL